MQRQKTYDGILEFNSRRGAMSLEAYLRGDAETEMLWDITEEKAGTSD